MPNTFYTFQQIERLLDIPSTELTVLDAALVGFDEDGGYTKAQLYVFLSARTGYGLVEGKNIFYPSDLTSGDTGWYPIIGAFPPGSVFYNRAEGVYWDYTNNEAAEPARATFTGSSLLKDDLTFSSSEILNKTNVKPTVFPSFTYFYDSATYGEPIDIAIRYTKSPVHASTAKGTIVVVVLTHTHILSFYLTLAGIASTYFVTEATVGNAYTQALVHTIPAGQGGRIFIPTADTYFAYAIACGGYDYRYNYTDGTLTLYGASQDDLVDCSLVLSYITARTYWVIGNDVAGPTNKLYTFGQGTWTTEATFGNNFNPDAVNIDLTSAIINADADNATGSGNSSARLQAYVASDTGYGLVQYPIYINEYLDATKSNVLTDLLSTGFMSHDKNATTLDAWVQETDEGNNIFIGEFYYNRAIATLFPPPIEKPKHFTYAYSTGYYYIYGTTYLSQLFSNTDTSKKTCVTIFVNKLEYLVEGLSDPSLYPENFVYEINVVKRN